MYARAIAAAILASALALSARANGVTLDRTTIKSADGTEVPVEVATPAGTERIATGFDGDGLRFEIEEVHRCLEAGLTESPSMPLAESLRLATTMDEILRQVGVDYDAG